MRIAAGTATVLLATGGLVLAQTPTWTSSPGSGPSPNTIQVSGTECRINPNQVVIPGEVIVRLYATDNTTVLHSQNYTPDTNGVWSGPFNIPAGLAPATYPLTARCGPPGDPTNEPGFNYAPDRSYRVLARRGTGGSDPATPVETEVTFTG